MNNNLIIGCLIIICVVYSVYLGIQKMIHTEIKNFHSKTEKKTKQTIKQVMQQNMNSMDPTINPMTNPRSKKYSGNINNRGNRQGVPIKNNPNVGINDNIDDLDNLDDESDLKSFIDPIPQGNLPDVNEINTIDSDGQTPSHQNNIIDKIEGDRNKILQERIFG